MRRRVDISISFIGPEERMSIRVFALKCPSGYGYCLISDGYGETPCSQFMYVESQQGRAHVVCAKPGTEPEEVL